MGIAMKTKWLVPFFITLFVLVTGAYLSGIFLPVRPYRLVEMRLLQERVAEKRAEKGQVAIGSALSNRERDETLVSVDREISALERELWFRKIRFDFVLPILGLTSIFGIFLVLLGGRLGLLEGFRLRGGNRDLDRDAIELSPAEEYINESELHYRVEGGFATRRQAIAFIQSDAMRRCPYCGGLLSPKKTEGRFKIQPVNFFKKVPEGAIDRRLRLGSVWSVVNPPEVTCDGCQAVVKL